MFNSTQRLPSRRNAPAVSSISSEWLGWNLGVGGVGE